MTQPGPVGPASVMPETSDDGAMNSPPTPPGIPPPPSGEPLAIMEGSVAGAALGSVGGGVALGSAGAALGSVGAVCLASSGLSSRYFVLTVGLNQTVRS